MVKSCDKTMSDVEGTERIFLIWVTSKGRLSYVMCVKEAVACVCYARDWAGQCME